MSVVVEKVSTPKNNPCMCPNMNEEEQQKNGDHKEDHNAYSKSSLEISDTPSKKVVENIKGDESESQKIRDQSMDKTSIEGDKKGGEVKIMSLTVMSPGREDVVLPIPFPSTTSKSTLFTLKEGTKYRIKFHFTVSHNLVTNLTYSYMVWKSGLRVHQTKKLMGTFSPRQEPYIFELEEGTTPTGFFARGPFFVRSKFGDEDGNFYLDTTYYFDIRKDWGAREKC